jgi:hypothetical protein
MIYKRDNKYFIYRFIQTLIFPIFILVANNYHWMTQIFVFFILLLFIVWEFYAKKIFAIRIQGNKINLFFFQFFQKKEAVYNPNELMYSYKNEAGARGIQSMDFRIFKNKKVVIKGIGRSIDGWSNDTINEIISEFKKLGIKEIE